MTKLDWICNKINGLITYISEIVRDIFDMFRGTNGSFSDKKVILFMLITTMLHKFSMAYTKAISLMGADDPIPDIPQGWIYMFGVLILCFLAPDAVIKMVLAKMGQTTDSTTTATTIKTTDSTTTATTIKKGDTGSAGDTGPAQE
jgi:hypothetical protein